MDSVITLIAHTRTQDSDGVRRKLDCEREAFCRVSSVSQKEFFEGGRNGLNPDFRVTVFHGDYHGERDIVHEGAAYGVYRTYRNGDYVELYCERKGGTNGKADAD